MINTDANEAPLTVAALLERLALLPPSAQVVVRYDADVVEDGDLEVFQDGGKVVIRTDAGLFKQ